MSCSSSEPLLGQDLNMNASVSFDTLLNGYSQADQRFKSARLGRDQAATFLPLFEALNWAVALDDFVAEHWHPGGEPRGLGWRDWLDEEGAAVVQGMRFVRNRVHHQWAKAVRFDSRGFQFPMELPLVFHEWCWLPSQSLPTSSNTRGIEQYGAHFTNRPVRLSLTALGRVYLAVSKARGWP